MENVPDLIDDEVLSDEDNEEAWEDCDNEERLVINTLCLFCEQNFQSPKSAITHLSASHGFKLAEFVTKHHIEYFDYIKLINFCRAKSPSPGELGKLSPAAWHDDSYMKPVIADDGLLQTDPEDIEEIQENGDAMQTSAPPMEAEEIKFDNTESRDILVRCRQAEEREKQAEQALQMAMEDMEKMRLMAGTLLSGAFTDVAPVPSHSAIRHLQDDEDDAYISGYSHFSIHEEMLKDRTRTRYYRDCIYENAALFRDKVVLDVGCGTGILSMFAARAGAKRVIGVDMSDIIYQAIDIVRENELDHIVTLMKGRMEDIELPVEKVDIIISEWMGYFLLFESMLDTVLWARDRYLAEGGLILPDYCDLMLIGVADTAMTDSHVKYWEDVYGFKMNCMKNCVLKEASVGVVRPDSVATLPARIKELDLCTCSTKDLEFQSDFQLRATADTTLTALAGYFDIKWVLPDKACCFSTSPSETPTHWKQTIFLLHKPVVLKKGSTLEGTLWCRKNSKDPRSLDVTLTLEGKQYSYYLT